MPAIMNKMRENTHVILIILVLAFIATIVFDWGMNYLGYKGQGVPHGGTIGEVNGRKISYDLFFKQLQQEYTNIRERTGQEPTEAQMSMVRDRLWERMVNDILVEEQIKKHGITVSDAEIVNILKTEPPAFLQDNPNFLTDNKFDPKKYTEALQNPNVDWSLVENAIRGTQPSVKMQDRILSAIRFTNDEVTNEYYREKTRAKASYVFVGTSDMLEQQVTLSDTAIQSYYAAHKEEFKEPEKRKIQYIFFPTFTTVEDSQNVYKQAEEILARVKSGEDFAELARQFSQDPSADRGGDLGYFRPGDMVKEFEDAVVNAQNDEVVGPVKSRFGIHLIKVVDKKYKKKSEIDSMRVSHILLKIGPSTATIDNAKYKANYFAEVAKEIGFDKATQENSYTPQETDFFGKGGFIPGIGLNEELARFAFSKKVDEVSPSIQTPRGFYVARILTINKEQIPPLDEAKIKIENILREQYMKSAAHAKIIDVYKQILNGKSFEDAAQAAKLTIKTTEEFGSTEYVQGIGREPNFTAKVLSLKAGEISPPIETTRGYYIMKLLEKRDPNMDEFQKAQGEIIQRLIGEKQQLFLISWISNLRKDAKIKDYRDDFFIQ